MKLSVASLNSGSNGNCYFIGNGDDAILVDAGISCREIEKRLKRLGLSIRMVKAVFITHEHGDHIHGLAAICRRHQLPVYITARTKAMAGRALDTMETNTFISTEAICVGGLTISAFPIRHDAAEPHNFVISNGAIRVGIFTDIGYACEHVIHHFRQCNAAFLEANYDDEMLERGPYPWPLKNRIRGGFGHLSNRQALKLFREHKPSFMSHLFLSHLSEENNSPEMVAGLFQKVAGRTNVVVASRHQETALYEINGQFQDFHGSSYSRTVLRQTQLTLGF